MSYYLCMIILWIFVGILFVWLGGLTYLFLRLRASHMVLTEGVQEKTLENVLAKIVKDVSSSKKHIEDLVVRCDTIEKKELFNIQKIGLLRFNPFKDTGGDQSFILALLDAQDSGVVITALYSRSGTRWYSKRVLQGKGAEHELSEEEKKTIKLANKQE